MLITDRKVMQFSNKHIREKQSQIKWYLRMGEYVIKLCKTSKHRHTQLITYMLYTYLLWCGHVWRPEDKFVVSVLCFLVYRGSRYHIKAKHLPLQSHLTSHQSYPIFLFAVFLYIQQMSGNKKHGSSSSTVPKSNSKIIQFLVSQNIVGPDSMVQ